jgi:hypothetical protein
MNFISVKNLEKRKNIKEKQESLKKIENLGRLLINDNTHT